jgi:hypothetical protein
MNGAGNIRLLVVATLALGTLSAALSAHAQETAPGNSWQPVTPAPSVPAKPAEPLPKETTQPAAPKSWAPADLGTHTETAPPAATPSSQVCAKAEFEAVVDDAAGALRDLNMQNKPAFQEKLRQLKDKRGWSHDAFLKEAAPYVRDDKIAVYDQESERLLADISTLGQEGAEAPTPDCALLADLKTRMKTLVDTQTAKWTYMFQKLETALAQ